MGEAKALMLHASDNIAVCTTAVAAGDTVEVIRPDGTRFRLAATGDIAYCNKIALVDLAEGDEVLKYGEAIGKMVAAAARGSLVSHLNLASQPRAYADEYILGKEGK